MSNVSKDEALTVVGDVKQEALNVAQQKINDFKYQLLKEALDYRQIEYDRSISDYNSLKRSLKETNIEYYETIEPICNGLDEKLAKVFIELQNGSKDAFTKFVKNDYESIVKPIHKSKELVKVNITSTNEVALKEANKVYKLKRGNKASIIVNKNYELNRIIQELEITRNNKGKIVNTRFTSDVVKEIREFFVKNHIYFEDTGYLSLRNAIYNLDYENKLLLADTINQKMGGFIDIGDRLKPYDTSVFTKLNQNVVKPVGSGIAIGASAAAVVNSIDPAILSGPIAGFCTTYLVNSKIVQLGNLGKWLVGLTSAGGAFGLERIPYVGSFFEKTFRAGNVAALGIAGAAITIAGVTLLYTAKGLRKIGVRVFEGVEQRKIEKKDAELYEEDNKKEYLRVIDKNKDANVVLNNLIIDLVMQYLHELGITLDNKPDNLAELKASIDGLEHGEKRNVQVLFADLVKLEKDDPQQLADSFTKAMKYTEYAKQLDIPSVKVYDLLSVGGFLPYIRENEVFETSIKDENELVDVLKNYINENDIRGFVSLVTRINSRGLTVPLDKVFNGMEYEKLEEFLNLFAYSNIEIDPNIYTLISKPLIDRIRGKNVPINNGPIKAA